MKYYNKFVEIRQNEDLIYAINHLGQIITIYMSISFDFFSKKVKH